MKTISEQIALFLAESGLTSYRLAKEAGLNRSYLSRLLNGRQRAAFSYNADAIREAMKRLDSEAAKKALS